jgi:hypothetical protein
MVTTATIRLAEMTLRHPRLAAGMRLVETAPKLTLSGRRKYASQQHREDAVRSDVLPEHLFPSLSQETFKRTV